MELGGQRHVPAVLPSGKNPVPIVQEVGWASGRVWAGPENLAPTKIRSPDRPNPSETLYQLHYPGRMLPTACSFSVVVLETIHNNIRGRTDKFCLHLNRK